MKSFIEIFTAVAHAQGGSADQTNPENFQDGLNQAHNIAVNNKLSDIHWSALLINIINFALGFVGLLSVAALIYAGFLYITSIGDDKKTAQAKSIVFYVVIGLILIGFSALIVNTVISKLIGGSAVGPAAQ